jgi:hypothetical protein
MYCSGHVQHMVSFVACPIGIDEVRVLCSNSEDQVHVRTEYVRYTSFSVFFFGLQAEPMVVCMEIFLEALGYLEGVGSKYLHREMKLAIWLTRGKESCTVSM